MGRNPGGIMTMKDLDVEAWEEIFSNHLGHRVRLSRPSQARDFEALNEGPNNQFNSEIVKATIDVQNDDAETVSYHVIIKNPLGKGFMMLLGRFLRPFMTENFFYQKSHVFPEVSDLFPACYFGTANYDEQLFDPPACERHCCFLCWFCCRKEEKGMLILEDLSKRENPFKTISKTKVPTIQHVMMAMHSLARFHGTWFDFLNRGDKRTDVGFTPAEIRKTFRKDLSFLIKSFSKLYQESFRSVIQLMKNRNEDEELIKRVEKYSRSTFIERLKTAMKMDLKGTRLETMLHGDFWTNNFMFQEDEHGVPIAMKFLDFQVAALGHPAVDLLYFFYICTDLDFRKHHLDACLREYFSTLEGYLRPTLKMSFEEFMEEFNERRDLALIGGLGVAPNVMSPNQVQLTFRQMRSMGAKRHREIASADKPDDHPDILEIRRRLVDLVKDFDELGLLS